MDLFSRFSWRIILTVLAGSPACAWTIWKAPPTSADCTGPVPFADTEDCKCYYQCFQVTGKWELIHSCCSAAGHWDDEYKACVEGVCGPNTTTLAPAPATPTTTTQKVTEPPVQTTKPTATTPTPIGTSTPKATSAISTSTQSPPVTTKATTPPSGYFLCPYEGFVADPNNCRGYYLCVRIRGRMYYYPFHCFIGTVWNSRLRRCMVGNPDICTLEK